MLTRSSIMKKLVLPSLLGCWLIVPAGAESPGGKKVTGDDVARPPHVKRQAAAKKPTGRPASTSEIKKGKLLYQSYDCAACHRIAGKGCAEGVPLDGVGSRRSGKFLTEHLKDPEDHVSKNPKAFGGDPTNLMPVPNLDGNEIRLIVAYLQTLR